MISEKYVFPDSAEQIYQEFLDRGWTDGLPIIPPTVEAVERAIARLGKDPQEIVTHMPPKWGEATVEKIAINAVMAGCLPEYIPVLITAIKAMTEPQFNLFFVQTTTHPCAPLAIINGPIAKELKINSGSGVFGPCFRSNATIGRAIRLCLINIGGAIPGKSDMATQGQSCKYSFCIAENEDESPWEPLHVEKGFDRDTSTVTVVAAENPHNINDHGSTCAEDLLITIAGGVTNICNNNVIGQGGNPILALGPEHAATIANEGYSKDDIRTYLYEKARVPLSKFAPPNAKRFFPTMSADSLIPIVAKKEDLTIIVTGGPGKHSSYLPSSSGTWAVTKSLD